MAAARTGWNVTRQSLDAAAHYGSNRLWTAAAYALTIAFCSFGATGTALVSKGTQPFRLYGRLYGSSGMRCLPDDMEATRCAIEPPPPTCCPPAAQALARPICLWLHVPAQAATMLLIASRNTAICCTPALQHPAAQRAAAAIYAFLCTLLGLLPLPPAAPAGLPLWHSPLGQCRAVLSMAELALGFIAPTLVLAAAESSLYMQYARHWQAAQRQQELAVAGQEAGSPAGTATTSSAAGASSSLTERGSGLLPAVPAAARQRLQQSRELQGGKLEPPGRLAGSAYRCLHACLHPRDVADWAMTWLMGTLLFCAAWQAVLLLTPP